jgi:predicted PolB exonuclease-like 3'-5' exonuclease
MTPVLAFDIETVPDVEGIRRLYGVEAGVPDADVAEYALARRRARTGGDFLPLHLHRVVAVACALREGEGFHVWSLGAMEDGEGEIIRRLFDGIERYSPQLVTWNGSGFDMPVLHYRSLIHGLSAPRYWEMGDDDRDFRYNNYINRYHTRHLDLMDLLALYNGRNYGPLDELAQLLGFPGKLGMDGSRVWESFQRGEIARIRSYCETDTANTFLAFLRFQLLRGAFDESRYRSEIALVRDALSRNEGPHWREFLAAWPA